MTRRELVRLMVLNSICDDYENIDQVILREVSRDGAESGLVVERPEIVEALAWLVEKGLAKAYLLTSTEPEIQGMPNVEVPEEYFETYFYITPAGKVLHTSGHGPWPHGDDIES